MSSSNNLEALRTYWEFPAVAHFCSLFKTVFKLVDFDIEDFEDALIIDTECAEDGGRSSLIVDILVALLKGQGGIGKRGVTLLNYNQRLHETLHARWYMAGLGPNPLGDDKTKANFHKLPLYAKLKILHTLCEWRLDRPDVEALTRDFTGEHLRVLPLGKDDKGLTYWYFYGTRLYCSEPEPGEKLRSRSSRKEEYISDNEEQQQEQEETAENVTILKTPTIVKHRRKRKCGQNSGDSAYMRKKKRMAAASRHKVVPPLKIRLGRSNVGTEKTVEDNTDDSTRDSFVAEKSENNATTSQSDKNVTAAAPPTDANDSASSLGKQRYPKTEDDDTVVAVVTKSSDDEAGVKDEKSEDADFFRLVYKTDEEEDDDEEDEAEELTGEEDSRQSETNKITTTSSVQENDDHASRSSVRDDIADENTNEPTISRPEASESAVDNNVKKELPSEDPNPDNSTISQEPSIPSWDQPLLRPPNETRWRLACYTYEDWKQLAEQYANATSHKEKELHRILSKDFLPAIESLFIEIEQERMRKLAELAPRRASDRIELKKLKKELDDKELAVREQAEIDRLRKMEDEKNRKYMSEKREQRFKIRELEREKRLLMRSKARDERNQRLEIRKIRQQFIAEGKEVPEELLTSANDMMNDDELEELDREIELEHMYGQLEKLIDAVKTTPEASPFLEPVTGDMAPDYAAVIKNPMDLETLEDKLLDRKFRSKSEFINDFNLILLNCLEYNGIYSEYVKSAARLERSFIRAYKRFFPPNDMQDFSERARQEELECIGLLGALDRKIKETVMAKLMAEAEEKEAKKRQQRTEAAEERERKRRLAEEEMRRHQIPYRQLMSAAAAAAAAAAQPPHRSSASARMPVDAGGGVQDFAGYCKKELPRPPPTLGVPAARYGSMSRNSAPVPVPAESADDYIPLIRHEIKEDGGQMYSLNSKTDNVIRFCKFIDTEGKPAPMELVRRALPPLREQVKNLPKTVTTIMLAEDPESPNRLKIYKVVDSSTTKQFSGDRDPAGSSHTYASTGPSPAATASTYQQQVGTVRPTLNAKPSPRAAAATSFTIYNKAIQWPKATSSLPAQIHGTPVISAATLATRDPPTYASSQSASPSKLLESSNRFVAVSSNSVQSEKPTNFFITATTSSIQPNISYSMISVATIQPPTLRPVCSVAPILKNIRPAAAPATHPVSNVVQMPVVARQLNFSQQQQQPQQNRPPQLQPQLQQRAPMQQQQQRILTVPSSSTILLSNGQQLILNSGQLILNQQQQVTPASTINPAGGVSGQRVSSTAAQPIILRTSSGPQPVQVIQVLPQQILVNRASPAVLKVNSTTIAPQLGGATTSGSAVSAAATPQNIRQTPTTALFIQQNPPAAARRIANFTNVSGSNNSGVQIISSNVPSTATSSATSSSSSTARFGSC